MSNNRAPWATEAVIAKMRDLWEEGLSMAAIGRRLGVSKGAIVGMTRRLEWTARIAVTRDATTGEAPDPPAMPRRATRPVIAAPAPRPARPVYVRPPVLCCWLDRDQPPYLQCEALTVGRTPYCDAHAAKAYSSAGWRQREAAESHTSMGGDN